MYILEKLWRGDLSPSTQFIRSGSDYQSNQKKIADLESKVMQELTPEGQEQFQAFLQLVSENHGIENQENYISGFRSGARIILDVVGENKGQLYSIEDL